LLRVTNAPVVLVHAYFMGFVNSTLICFRFLIHLHGLQAYITLEIVNFDNVPKSRQLLILAIQRLVFLKMP